ncbi:MAG: electron transport complex subunit RsxG [Gammaproteobacteria bacterium]|nr:electron transport complex subunit RsxG [Gammaproteobacteria bacterium]
MATKQNILESMKQAGISLGLFAVIATAIVAVTFFVTKDRIIENERLALLNSLHALIPANRHDNDLYADTILLDVKSLNYRNKPVTVYRARLDNEPAAAIFSVTAPDGYTGAIKLLVAINTNNTIAGVRVISHKETPGLGDGIDIEKSNWITSFDGRSFSNPTEKRWLVKKDGGDFDQLTGATITPRAIVKMTKKTLQYFQSNHVIVFATQSKETKAGK